MTDLVRLPRFQLLHGYAEGGLPPHEDALPSLAGESSMLKEIQLFRRSLEAAGKSITTVEAYTRDLKEFAAHAEAAGVLAVPAINADLVAEWLARYRDRGCAENTVCRKNSSLRAFFVFCRKRGIAFLEDAAPLVRKNRDQIPRIPTPEEIEAMLATCSRRASKFVDQRDRAFLLFLWSTGCRRGEAIGLNMADLKFKRTDNTGEWRAEARVLGKGSRQRVVFVGARAAKELDAYLKLRRPNAGDDNQAAVWLSRTDNRLTASEASAIVARRAKDAGIDWGVTAHSLRHAFATGMLRAGADLHTLSKMLGHRDLATTQVYLHYCPERAREMHERLDPAAINRALSG